MKGLPSAPVTTVALPIRMLTKTEIDETVEGFLNHALTFYPAEEIYVAIKQLEEANKVAIRKLKEVAVESAGERFKGESRGTIFGHKVELRSRTEWSYSQEVQDLVERQKAELKSAQLAEQATGKAIKLEADTQIIVTLAK